MESRSGTVQANLISVNVALGAFGVFFWGEFSAKVEGTFAGEVLAKLFHGSNLCA